MRFLLMISLLTLILLSACGDANTISTTNPAAEGFNQAASDAKAIELADQVMTAMGGREAWDDTKVISWSFSGKRHLVWDKHTGDVRITSPADSTVYLVNVFSGKGEIMVRDTVIKDAKRKQELLEKAKSIWINDSYWLVMPFKLKDSGVTLKYLGEGVMQDGTPAHILQLTFKEVGVTPNNKYHVWIDHSDHLLKQWAFYRDHDKEEPNYIRPWDNYQPYGKILLSADRSDKVGPSDVQVYDQVDPTVFTEWGTPSIVNM